MDPFKNTEAYLKARAWQKNPDHGWRHGNHDSAAKVY